MVPIGPTVRRIGRTGRAGRQPVGRSPDPGGAAIVAGHGTRLRTPQRAASAGRDRLDARLRRDRSASRSRRSGSASRPSGRPSTTSSMTATCRRSSSSARRSRRRRRASSSGPASSSRRCTTRSAWPRTRRRSSCSATAGWSSASGSGWSEIEFAGLGADARRRGAAMDEILAILPQAWSGEPFTHQGAVYDLPTLGVRPTAVDAASRCSSAVAPSPRSAAPRASPTASSRTPRSRGSSSRCAGCSTSASASAATRRPSGSSTTRCCCRAPRATEALARYRDALWAMQWKYSDMEASATRPLPPPSPPPFDRPDEALVKGRATYAGTPDELVEALLDIRQQAGVPVEFVGTQPPPAPRVRRAGRADAAARRGRRAARLRRSVRPPRCRTRGDRWADRRDRDARRRRPRLIQGEAGGDTLSGKRRRPAPTMTGNTSRFRRSTRSARRAATGRARRCRAPGAHDRRAP